MAAILEVKYFNAFTLKKVVDSSTSVNGLSQVSGGTGYPSSISFTEQSTSTTGAGSGLTVSGSTTGSIINPLLTIDNPGFGYNTGDEITVDSISGSGSGATYTIAGDGDTTINTIYPEPCWPGNVSYPSASPTFPTDPATGTTLANSSTYNWMIEESRIRGGYNNTTVDFGVKAYVEEEDAESLHRSSSMIYSGVFNSKTGVNETNQFFTAKDITKDTDPSNGSIQKLYAEDSNLIVFQEDKVSRALIDKNVIYSGEQGSAETIGIPVIGQIVPYVGEYGISRNPESFAKYGFRKYFVDKDRGVVLRLSRDGITEISGYGMSDYFRDSLAIIPDTGSTYNVTATSATSGPGGVSSIDITSASAAPRKGMIILVNGVEQNSSYISNVIPITATSYTLTIGGSNVYLNSGDSLIFSSTLRPRIPGGWDIHNRNYTISLNNQSNYFPLSTNGFGTLLREFSDAQVSTVVFDDSINGWVSFYDYNPTFVGSLKDKYYSFVNGNIYEHYYLSLEPDNSPNKKYQYFYGSDVDSNITFVFNPNPSVSKNFLTINYEGSNGWEVFSFKGDYQGYDETTDSLGNTVWTQYQDSTLKVRSLNEGKYLDTSDNIEYQAGFYRKENKYVANLVNNSEIRPKEAIYGPGGLITRNNRTSGVKGYFATVVMSTDSTTNPNGPKELFAVSSNYSLSAY